VTLHRQEPLFTMSALNGLLAIRRYLKDHPGILLQEVIAAIKRVSADDANHNYEAALVLHKHGCNDRTAYHRLSGFFS